MNNNYNNDNRYNYNNQNNSSLNRYYDQNKYNDEKNIKLRNQLNKEHKIFSKILPIFYLTCIIFLVITLVYKFNKKTTFYLSYKDVAMIVNSDYRIGLYGNTEEKTNDKFTFTSTNPDIITVNEDGVIHSVSEGEASVIVKAKVGGQEKTMNVIVQGEAVYSVEFENDNVTLDINENIKANPIVNNNVNFKSKFNWSSENPKIASVASDGTITANGAGTTYIKVSVLGTKISTKMKVTVNDKVDDTVNNSNAEINDDGDGFEEAFNSYIGVQNVSIKSSKKVLLVGDELKLEADIAPNDASNKEVIWGTSDETIATIDKKGNIKALKAGHVDVTVKTIDGNKTSFVTLEIKNKESDTKISLNKNNITLKVGQSDSIVAKVNNNKKVVWSSSDTSIVVVDANGKIYAKKNGAATILCTTEDKKATASVSIKVESNTPPKKEIKMTSIILNKSSIQLNQGNSYKIGVSIKPVDTTNKSLNFKSSNEKVATIDSEGRIKGVGLGTATIKVSAKDGSGKFATLNVVITPRTSLININKKKYTSYIKNIENYIDYNQSKHIQNFAIQNIGKSNEIIFLSGVENGSIKANKISKSQKDSLAQTLVIRIPKNELRKNTNKRKIMWLKNSGHGQSFDIENKGTIWINAFGTNPVYSSGTWWGKYNGVMRINFKANSVKSNFSPLETFKIKDSSGNIYPSPEVSVDEDNNLLALRSGVKVFVYRLSEAKKGKLSYLYSFKIPSLDTYKQGQDIYGGFYYMLYGKKGGKMTVVAYNMLGEVAFTKEFYIKNASQAQSQNEEAEGLKIYNNKIYIGHTHKLRKGNIFDIGVFK